MDRNIANILLGELHSASAYFERIMHAIMDITPYGGTREAKELISVTYFEIISNIEINIIQNSVISKQSFDYSSRELRTKIASSAKMFESMLKLDFNCDAICGAVVSFINTIYENSFKLHKFGLEKNGIEIQYPRLNIIEMEEIELSHLGTTLLKFSFPIEKLEGLKRERAEIFSLAAEKDKKYNAIIQKGHTAIFHKRNDQALDCFLKARNIKDTAEVLTLIGWCYSLNQNWEKAKTYCLKAIQNDADYGPSYNDLGNYLLSEGQVNESLKWFELAKKATNYQNREYPYINAGRAYIIKKEYNKALEEFSKALTIAPYNDDLHQTVLRLRKGLEKENDIFDNLNNNLSNNLSNNLNSPEDDHTNP